MAIDALSSRFRVVAVLGGCPAMRTSCPDRPIAASPRLDGGRQRARLEAVTSIREESPG